MRSSLSSYLIIAQTYQLVIFSRPTHHLWRKCQEEERGKRARQVYIRIGKAVMLGSTTIMNENYIPFFGCKKYCTCSIDNLHTISQTETIMFRYTHECMCALHVGHARSELLWLPQTSNLMVIILFISPADSNGSECSIH